MAFTTCRKVVGSRLDYVKDVFFFSIYKNPSGRTRPWGSLISNRNEYQSRKIMFLGSRARPVLRVDNLTAICEPIV
jgi:hypothetical protein